MMLMFISLLSHRLESKECKTLINLWSCTDLTAILVIRPIITTIGCNWYRQKYRYISTALLWIEELCVWDIQIASAFLSPVLLFLLFCSYLRLKMQHMCGKITCQHA